MEFNLYGKVLKYNHDMEQYVKIMRQFKSIFNSAKYNELFQIRNPGNATFEQYFTAIAGIYKKYVEKGITTAIGILYDYGMKYVDDEEFINTYMDSKFSIDTYMEPLVEKVENIYNQATSAQRQQELKAASRSKWVGGGFGLTGAVKGAITAKALNVGTDFLHSFGDSRQTGQISEQFRSRQYALLNHESTYQISERAIYNCIMGIFESTINELLQNGYLSSLSIEPQKAKALYKNSMRFGRLDLEGVKEMAVECLQMDPFFLEIYTDLLECDSENEELIKLAIYFDTYPEIDEKISALKKEIMEMDSTTAEGILEKLEKYIKKEKLYNFPREIDAISGQTVPDKIVSELIEFCKNEVPVDIDQCILKLKDIQRLTAEWEPADALKTLAALKDERKAEEDAKQRRKDEKKAKSVIQERELDAFLSAHPTFNPDIITRSNLQYAKEILEKADERSKKRVDIYPIVKYVSECENALAKAKNYYNERMEIFSHLLAGIFLLVAGYIVLKFAASIISNWLPAPGMLAVWFLFLIVFWKSIRKIFSLVREAFKEITRFNDRKMEISKYEVLYKGDMVFIGQAILAALLMIFYISAICIVINLYTTIAALL